jgi:hypothetical protein
MNTPTAVIANVQNVLALAVMSMLLSVFDGD